ncbi:MAG: hypothetical protein J6Q74_00380 [Clostridia bacterium]|nr:hypothetical protein [Clostridia bacterium]
MDKNKSETLRQREKAQRDLLELKKMQSGALDTEHLKDDDKKIVPKTLDEKCDNFFYHHKTKLIIFGFLAVVLTIMIASCFTRIDYDATVTIYCYEFVDSETIEETAEWFETFFGDTNLNGKVEVLCTDCSFAKETDFAETITQKQMKIQAVLTSAESLLFILDEESLEYLNSITDSFELFSEENIVELDDSYYNSLSGDRLSFKDKNKKRFLCLRTIDDTLIEGKAQKYFDEAKKALQKVRNMK